MAASFSQTIVVGNLGRDPETRYPPNGDAVCNFSVAVTESWTSNGEKKEQTTWYRVAAFKKLAEICSQYLKKGSSVMIVGKMNVREWEKDGVKRESWELRADSMQMLGGKHDGQQSGSSAQTSRPAPASKPAASSSGSFNDFEDDIPFLQIGRGASAYVI